MPGQLDATFVRMAPGRTVSRLIGYSLFEGRPLTTRGRWWNPVVFGHLRLAMARPRQRVERPVFIVGMGRSGTTLLGQVLAAHPLVGFLNEPKAMWHLIRSDEDIIGSYATQPGRLYLDAGDADEEVVRRAHTLFSWYLRASRSQRVVDKYPELVFRHRFVRAIFPDARFLIAVRSPASVLPSVAAWSASHAVDGADWWGSRDQKWRVLWREAVTERPGNADIAALGLEGTSDHRVRAAVEWLTAAREALELAESDPNASFVRYEDLVRDPRGTVRDVLDDCGLPASARTEAYAEAVVRSSGPSPSSAEVLDRAPGELGPLLQRTWSSVADPGRLAQRS